MKYIKTGNNLGIGSVTCYYQSLCLFQPEWYFTQVLSWIRDHMDFMETRIQPLLIEAGKSSIDAKVRLITYNDTCSKISNTYLFLFSNKMLVIGDGKCLSL